MVEIDGVLENNMLKICTWRFSVDNKKVELFNNKDTLQLIEKSKGFVKIEGGLTDNGIKKNIGNSGLMTDFSGDNNTNLYIQPCADFEKMKSEPYNISEFGLNIENREGSLKVVNVERGGIADRNDIKPGDIILQIDSCALNNEKVRAEFIQYTKNKKEIKLVLKDKSVVLSQIIVLLMPTILLGAIPLLIGLITGSLFLFLLFRSRMVVAFGLNATTIRLECYWHLL